jgi:hypothetical protein
LLKRLFTHPTKTKDWEFTITPYDIQGVRKLEQLFDLTQEVTLKLIEASWHRAMIESGLGPVMVTEDWVTSLWEFLSDSHIRLRRLCTMFDRQLRFNQDSYIMKDVLQQPATYTRDELFLFNQCGLFLQVELLSDITTGDGKAVRQKLWKGTPDTCHEKFGKSYISIERIPSKAWLVWKRILQRTSNCNESGRFQHKQDNTGLEMVLARKYRTGIQKKENMDFGKKGQRFYKEDARDRKNLAI